MEGHAVMIGHKVIAELKSYGEPAHVKDATVRRGLAVTTERKSHR